MIIFKDGRYTLQYDMSVELVQDLKGVMGYDVREELPKLIQAEVYADVQRILDGDLNAKSPSDV